MRSGAMTPEEFMHTLTDMVYVEHFDAGTWKQPCDTESLARVVSQSIDVMIAYERHPSTRER